MRLWFSFNLTGGWGDLAHHGRNVLGFVLTLVSFTHKTSYVTDKSITNFQYHVPHVVTHQQVVPKCME